MADKQALLKEIFESSFAVNDMTLYLDTHPADSNALSYFKECGQRRKNAMDTFASENYPLTIDCISNLNLNLNQWTWGSAPAPWEGEANNVEL